MTENATLDVKVDVKESKVKSIFSKAGAFVKDHKGAVIAVTSAAVIGTLVWIFGNDLDLLSGDEADVPFEADITD